jgi:transglutaminase-like putative cysteine protease
MDEPKQHDGLIHSLVFYVLAFLLLQEWLRPLQDFTDTGSTTLFVIFVGLSFLLTYFKMKWYVTLLVVFVYIGASIQFLFYEEMFMSIPWFTMFIDDITSNLSYIGSGLWQDMTPSFRTMLFFVLLWLLVYLLHYWVIYQRKIFFFFLMTLVYVTVLDTFSPYNATFAIVRIVFIGFTLLGLLYIERLSMKERFLIKKAQMIRWIAPLFVLIFAAASIGIAAPKSAPMWSDPVPFIQSFSGQDVNGQGANKVGYGTNDERLGGPFAPDNTRVFTWEGEQKAYFRVETKNIYTGKGWLEGSNTSPSIQLSAGTLKNHWFENTVNSEEYSMKISVDPAYRFTHLMYPLGLNEVETENSVPLEIDPSTERIKPFREETRGLRNLGEYEITYDSPVYDLNELRDVKVPLENDIENLNLDDYLQLPESLPQRVKDLSADLTDNEDNMYDKAIAIEDYLGSSDYSYDTNDVAIPSEEEDYVDQFLFETKLGYCDNFSSSMVVLLRSSGIPARWVKGYTSGDYAQTVDGTIRRYEVSNNNAHSWVEAYFPGQGWVTFEPTKGFTNPAVFTEEGSSDSDPAATDPSSEEPQPEEPVQQEQQPKEQPQDKSNPVESPNNNASSFFLKVGDWFWYTAAAAIILLSVLLYLFRAKWLPYLIIAMMKNRKEEDVFFRAYDALLKQLKRNGLRKEEGQTLREFAKRVDDFYQTNDMQSLTEKYERALYRNESTETLWNHSFKLWENLIKKS